MPDYKNEVPAPEKETGTRLAKADADSSGLGSAVASQQVSWWSVHEHVAPLLSAVGSWPMTGTPEWCLLPAGDLRKLAGVFDAARHWALRVEMCQQARCEASRDVSAAADWSAIAVEKYRLDAAIADGSYYIRRVTS